MSYRQAWIATVLALSGLVSACGGGAGPAALSLPGTTSPPASVPAATTSLVPDMSALQKAATFTSVPKPVGSLTEIYTRVARGVLTCWFGASGPLKPGYIYHAEAEPPSKGGASVIDIRVRDKSEKDPRSLRAWRVSINPSDDGPKVDIENAKLPEHYAARLEGDVRRWAAAEEGCGESPITQGWSADAAPPAPAALQKAANRKP